MSALDHLETGIERFRRRVVPLLEDGTIRCILHLGEPGRQMCRIASVEVPSDYRRADVAAITIRIPATICRPRITSLPIDVDPVNNSQPVLAAAFADIAVVQQEVISSNLPNDGFFLLTGARPEVRVGTSVKAPEGAPSLRCPLLRTSIPLPPGFSGAPLMLKRPITSAIVALPDSMPHQHVVVGLLSYDASSEAGHNDQRVTGVSYAMPALSLFALSVSSAGTALQLSEAVQRGWISTSGDRAKRVYVDKNPPERPGSMRIRIR